MNKQSKANEIKVTFLDLKKAFDTVDHRLEKCSDYGLRGKILSIIASFLHYRTQVVKVNGKLQNLEKCRLEYRKVPSIDRCCSFFI